MAFWLKRLSAVFLLAGAVMAAFVTLRDPKAPQGTFKLRPQAQELLAEAQAILDGKHPRANAMVAAAMEDVKLPFIVIEPRDFAAPQVQLGAVPLQPQVQPPQSGIRLVQSPADQAMDLNPVEARLRARVPAEIIPYFDLFLYVSKATPDKGSWAQRMFVLAKEKDQQETFRLLHNWPVSTGKEQIVESPSGKMLGTHTPAGIFKLDRDRFYEDYTSRQWKSPMPFAMFFDWNTEGRRSGLAIHGSDAKGEAELGTRASHGCIRLSSENAGILFKLIQGNYRGRVPMFATDPNSGTMSTKGLLVRDETGKPKLVRGYKVLVFIEDFGGPSVDTVAALY